MTLAEAILKIIEERGRAKMEHIRSALAGGYGFEIGRIEASRVLAALVDQGKLSRSPVGNGYWYRSNAPLSGGYEAKDPKNPAYADRARDAADLARDSDD